MAGEQLSAVAQVQNPAFGALLLFAALAFWMALFIIPVLLLLGVAGYFYARHQIKRGRFVVTTRRF